MLKLRRTLRATLPAGLVGAALIAAAAVGLATTTSAAATTADNPAAVPASAAGASDVHTINVALPDGGVARVTYRGNVAPRVALVPVDRVAMPVMFAPMAFGNPFAIDPMFAAMERDRVAMLRQMDARINAIHAGAQQRQQLLLRQASAPGVVPTAGRVGGATVSGPGGTGFSYSFVSTSGGPQGCTQTVEWRSDGSGKEPQVVRNSSGDCGAVGPSGKAKALMPNSAGAPARAPQPAAVPAKPAPVRNGPNAGGSFGGIST